MIRHEITASEVKVDDRLDSAKKSRVSVVRERNGKIMLRIETKGSRSPSVSILEPTDSLNVWR